MQSPLKLMCLTAHPDDESLAMGGTLAKYAQEEQGYGGSTVLPSAWERRPNCPPPSGAVPISQHQLW